MFELPSPTPVDNAQAEQDPQQPDESAILEELVGEEPEAGTNETESSIKEDILLRLGFPKKRLVFLTNEMDEVAMKTLELLDVPSLAKLDSETLSDRAATAHLDIAVSQHDSSGKEDELEHSDSELKPTSPWIEITMNDLTDSSLNSYKFKFRRLEDGSLEIRPIIPKRLHGGNPVWSLNHKCLVTRKLGSGTVRVYCLRKASFLVQR